MRWVLLVASVVVTLTGCARGHRAPENAPQSAAIAASPSAAPTPAFTDLQGVSQATNIDQLAQLSVFFPAGGAFEPNRPVLRREFARWLVHADDAIWAQNPSVAVQPSHVDDRPYFTDVPADDPDFTAIEGLHDAGVVLAPGRRFGPNLPITREDAVAIKAYVDCGEPDPIVADDSAQAYVELPPWKDKSHISRDDVAAIASCLVQDQGTTPDNQLDTIARTFGSITRLDPQRQLTRAEAAALIWKVGEQKPDLTNFPPRSAAQALSQ